MEEQDANAVPITAVTADTAQPVEEDAGETTVAASPAKHVLEAKAEATDQAKGIKGDDVSLGTNEVCSGGDTTELSTLVATKLDAPQIVSSTEPPVPANVSTEKTIVIQSDVLLTVEREFPSTVEAAAPTQSASPITTPPTIADDVSLVMNKVCRGGDMAEPSTLVTTKADAPPIVSSTEPPVQPNVSTAKTIVIQSDVLLTTGQEVPSTVEAAAPTRSATPIMTPQTIAVAATGLEMLAQYDSDNDADAYESAKESDGDSVMEVPATALKGYRSKVVEIDSDSDTSTTDSDSDVDKVTYLDKIRKTIDKSLAVHNEDDDEDDDEDGGGGGSSSRKRQPPRVKGEMLLDDLPPIQDLHISVPAEECVELGRVHSIVEQLVLVNVLPNSLLLDLETVLFLEKGKRVLGAVFDVLGQVADPMYCVRFNSHKQIEEKGISVGDLVYVAPKTEYTQFVILSSLMTLRGSDASWENDVEPPPRYLDYSDDEQEREARAQLRKKDRPTDSQNDDLPKRTRTDSNSITNSEPPAMQHRRGAGTSAGAPWNFRPQRQSPRAYPPHSYRPYGQHVGSWHSNYRAGPPPRYRPHMPPGYPMYAPPPPMPPFRPYGPPGVPAQMAMQPTVGPPPSMYVLNPYAMQPPVLPPRHGAPMYHSGVPPPPPPGAQ